MKENKESYVNKNNKISKPTKQGYEHKVYHIR